MIKLLFAISVLSFVEILSWSKFYDEKINYKKIEFYISLFLMSIFGLLNYFFVNAFIRMILLTFLFSFCNWLIFKSKFNQVVISTIFSQILMTIADVLSVLLLIFVFKIDTSGVKTDFFVTLFGNVLVSFIFLLINYIPYVKRLYKKLVTFTNRIDEKNLILGCLLLIISVNFLMAVIYYDMKFVYVIIINSVLLLVYSYIVFKIINERNDNIMIKAENVSLMESLHQYEDMVDRQRVDNHENKNQLLIIKNMIKKNDKDVIKYIDTVVKDEKEDDEALYTKVKSIPSGGLQGIIYQKMLSMKDNRILFSLDVSRDVRNIDLEKMDIEDNYKLCKIVGVLLDNAIEESLKIDDRRIMISLYVDDDMLIIDISNKFDGKIDLDKIDEEGYTTKGEGHGYGLSLVKKLVNGNDCFINERKVNKDVFKQIIKFKIK